MITANQEHQSTKIHNKIQKIKYQIKISDRVKVMVLAIDGCNQKNKYQRGRGL